MRLCCLLSLPLWVFLLGEVEVFGWCFNLVWSYLPGTMLWIFQGGTGQGHPPPVFFLQPPSISYKTIYRQLLLVLGLEMSSRGQAENQVQLLLCPAWGHLAIGTGQQRPDADCLKDFRKIWSVSQDRSFIWKNYLKHLEWAWMLVEWGLRESGKANTVSHVDRNSDMVPSCWLC